MLEFWKKRPVRTPFNKIEKIGGGKYFEAGVSADDPDLIIKTARTRWANYDNPGVHPLADLRRIKADLDILKKTVGEHIPPSQLVVGENSKGEETVYVIQHRIEGKDLDHAKYSEEINEQFKAFLYKTLDLYTQNLAYRGTEGKLASYIVDLKGENFIYGCDKKADAGERLYFVDTYPVEGGSPREYLESLLYRSNRFSGRFAKTFIDFQQDAKKRLQAFWDENKDKVPRYESASW